jgi:hypothetical protein
MNIHKKTQSEMGLEAPSERVGGASGRGISVSVNL